MKKRLFTVILAGTILFGMGVYAQATSIVGGSDLISISDVDTLEGWLGQDNIALTNIYSKSSGDTSAAFHSSVNGMGATFTIIEIINGANTHIVGGYNSQSWDSSSSYHITQDNSLRTAFLFNLTDLFLYRQGLNDGWGQYQTYNNPAYGPTFGAGHDLYINTTLSSGYANIGYSYGDISQAGSESYRNGFTGSYASWTVGSLEVFTIASDTTPVPEPASMLLLASGLLGLAGAYRKFSR